MREGIEVLEASFHCYLQTKLNLLLLKTKFCFQEHPTCLSHMSFFSLNVSISPSQVHGHFPFTLIGHEHQHVRYDSRLGTFFGTVSEQLWIWQK